jgi:hypothetical protein
MTTYEVVETSSGYAVVRDGGDLAEFFELDEAHEAAALLESGEKDEKNYEWYSRE